MAETGSVTFSGDRAKSSYCYRAGDEGEQAIRPIFFVGNVFIAIVELALWWLVGVGSLGWILGVAVAVVAIDLFYILWPLTSKRQIAKLVIAWFALVLLVALFVPGNLLYPGPSLEIPVRLYGGTHIEGYPTVTYYMAVSLRTNGAFSVGNPVNARIAVTYPNDSNFLSSYPYATISNALNIPPVHGTGSASGVTIGDLIQLTSYSNGSYIGSDEIIFTQPGNQNVSLTIKPNYSNPQYIFENTPLKIPLPKHPGIFVPPSPRVVTVSDASATVALDSTRSIARITIVIGAFSIILLQPVLEAFLLRNPPQAPTPPSPQPPKNSQPPTMSPGEKRRWWRRHPPSPPSAEKQDRQESDPQKD